MRKLTTTLALLSLCCSVFCAQPTISFSHLSGKDGLAPGSVTDLYFDENGIVWIGTGYGLCCYDGRRVIPFIFSRDAGGEIHSNSVLRITGDGKGHIFVACRGEVYRMDLKTSEVKTISDDDSRAIFHFGDSLYVAAGRNVRKYGADGNHSVLWSLKDGYDNLTSMTRDEEGTIWLGTDAGRIIRLPDGKVWSAGSYIESLLVDSCGKVWAGTMSNGLARLEDSGNVVHYLPGGPGTISSNFVRGLCEDDSGALWVGTFYGLNRMDRKTEEFTCFLEDRGKPDALTNNSIWQIRKDRQGTLWIGTFFGGINYFNPGREIFTRYNSFGKEGESLSSPVIGKIAEDGDGSIWVATEGGGMNRIDTRTGKVRWFRKENGMLPENNIKDFHYDRASGQIWIATHLGGLCRLDTYTGRSKVIRLSSGNEAKTDADDILAVENDGDSLFVGTKSGLFLLGKKDFGFRPVLEEKGLHLTGSLKLDNSRRLWITTGKGLVRYYPKNGKIEKIFEDISATDIFQDSRGRIWISSSRCGIYLFLPWEEKMEYISFSESWPTFEFARCVTESPVTGSLYILSSTGFSEFDPDTRKVRYRHSGKGFPLETTNFKALGISGDGTIYAGGTDGLVAFKESDLNSSPKPYRLFFDRLYLDGKEDFPDGVRILQYNPKVTIPADVSVFRVEFSSSDYISGNTPVIEYKLAGFSKEWAESGDGKSISYSNIPAGTYTLKIRPKGVAPEICPEAEISVRILAPWFSTFPARLIYVLLIAGLVFLSVQFFYEKKRRRDIEELNQSKLRFFTNISHEIRTPLTIIISEIEALMQQHSYTPSQYNKVLSIYKNSLSLKELISELLEFRKQEQGQMKIRVAPHNIVYFTNEFFLLFSEYASSKGVSLEFRKETERLEVWYDQRQMQKVLNNILSNALKFTGKGGNITLSVYSEGSSAVIEISDTGRGIPQSELNKIFERFYQVDQSDATNSGTGIGLSLALGIVKLHKGDIEVRSALDKGTSFKILLPLGYSHFSKEQMQAEAENDVKIGGIPGPVAESGEASLRSDHKIVIAEDNEEIRKLLCGLFSPIYETFPAEDGEKALALVRKHIPSIVISDVVMPGMSGTELCRRIKNDVETCHIPVVLLTARVDIEQNLEGLQTGADDYITKPFNSALLISRCNNLVNSRILLQEKFSAQPQTSAWALATNQMDKAFLEKVMGLISVNLSNSEFNVSDLAKGLALSRTALFSKIKAVTGQTPNDFLLTIRLKESAKLLKSNPELNVTEISERTGFNSARYFAKCFKSKYGISPLAYRKK